MTATSILNKTVDSATINEISHSVLVVGMPEGSVKTPAGLLPGHVLQASYVEGLISGWLLPRNSIDRPKS